MNENLLGIAGGVAMGYFGSRVLSQGKVSGTMPAQLQAQAERINMFFVGSTTELERKTLYGFIDQGWPAGIWAYTISQESDIPSWQHSNNPEAILCIRQLVAGWEFAVASMSGLPIDVWLDVKEIIIALTPLPLSMVYTEGS